MSRMTLSVLPIVEDNSGGYEFSFTVPEYSVSARGGMYFAQWSEAAKKRQFDEARAASRRGFVRKFVINPDCENEWIRMYLSRHIDEGSRFLIAAEMLAQRLFLGTEQVPLNPNTKGDAIYVLHTEVWERGIWFREQPLWFDQGIVAARFCSSQTCHHRELMEKSDNYCSKCGSKLETYYPPVLKELEYSCPNAECKNFKKPFDREHKRCHECGRKLGRLVVS